MTVPQGPGPLMQQRSNEHRSMSGSLRNLFRRITGSQEEPDHDIEAFYVVPPETYPSPRAASVSAIDPNAPCFIKKAYVTLNGKILDSVSEEENTEKFCVNDYYMFAKHTGCFR